MSAFKVPEKKKLRLKSAQFHEILKNQNYSFSLSQFIVLRVIASEPPRSGSGGAVAPGHARSNSSLTFSKAVLAKLVDLWQMGARRKRESWLSRSGEG